MHCEPNLLVLFLVIIGAYFALINSVPRPYEVDGCTNDNSYDYYNLALFYNNKSNYLKKYSTSFRSNSWTINGLWPSRATTQATYPCNCNSSLSTDTSLISNVSNLYWSPELQIHSYKKYGTCTNMTAFDYVLTTVSLYALYSPRPVLKKDRPYDYDELVYLFCSSIDVERNHDCMTLGCVYIDNRQYLSEIGLCLSKQFQFRPCPIISVRDEIDNCKKTDIYI